MGEVWRLIAGRRNFRLVVSAGLISLTGDWILMVGLMYRVYQETGSTLASALLMLAAFVPQVVLGSLAGVFVDRWDRKRTMVIANILMAVGLAPLLLIHGRERIWLAFPVMFFESIIQQFFAPAEQALFPTLVDDAELTSANGLNGQNQNLARLIGSALGGILSAAGGVPLVAAADLLSFLLAALLVGRVTVAVLTPKVQRLGESLSSRMAALRSEWLGGLRIVRANRVLMALAIFFVVTSVGEGDITTLFAPFVRSVLHGGSGAFGTIAGVQAIGGIFGGVAAAAIGHRISPVKLFGWGSVVFGTIDLAIILYPLWYVAIWPAVVGMIVVGVPVAIAMAGAMTLYQRGTEDAYRGRVWGALMTISGLGVLVGTTGAGLLAARFGVIPVLAYQGFGYLGSGLLLLRNLRTAVPDSLPAASEA